MLGGVELDDTSKIVQVDGINVSLTPTEYAILKLLISNQGKVYSPREIYKAIWSENPIASENTIAVHVDTYEKKLKSIRQNQDI
jgi:DNA-binding response OmpR family regulator